MANHFYRERIDFWQGPDEDGLPQSHVVHAEWTAQCAGFTAFHGGREKIKGDDDGKVFDVCVEAAR